MNNHLLAAAFTLASAAWSPAELVENGDFSKDASCWQIDVPDAYGPPTPAIQISDHALECSGLHKVIPGYLSISQAVEIKRNLKYKLTFEAKGEGSGQYLVAIHHPGKGAQFSKLNTPNASWEPVVIEFTGTYETDHKWARDWRRATKKNELKGGHTLNRLLHKLDEPKASDGPSHSLLTFAVGGLSGSLAIRNVSIVQVP